MKIEFDSAKNCANLEKHGISLAEAVSLEWKTAVIWPDTRRDYGEVRMSAVGYIGLRLDFVAFVDRDNSRRIISLRKASRREMKRYAQT